MSVIAHKSETLSTGFLFYRFHHCAQFRRNYWYLSPYLKFLNAKGKILFLSQSNWPKIQFLSLSFEMGKSHPIISVVISSQKWKLIKIFFSLFLIEKLKQLGIGKKYNFMQEKRDIWNTQAPCKCKEHGWNETNDLTGFWWAGWCKCFTLTTLHAHNTGANSSAMNTFLYMLSFKINKQKWVIYWVKRIVFQRDPLCPIWPILKSKWKQLKCNIVCLTMWNSYCFKIWNFNF